MEELSRVVPNETAQRNVRRQIPQAFGGQKDALVLMIREIADKTNDRLVVRR